MVKLKFCKQEPLPSPVFSHVELPLLLKAMVLDGLIVPRDASRVLQALAMVDRENVTLELLESVAPSNIYRVFRWLRGFCCENREPQRVVALNAVIPHVSAVIALSQLRGATKAVQVEVPRHAPQSIVAAVNRVAEMMGVPLEIEQCNETLARQVWRTPKAVDLISHALGEAAAMGRDVLNEVLESGGAIVGKALLDLFGERQRFLLKLLTAFDFLRPHVTGGGLVFALSQKALEVLT